MSAFGDWARGQAAAFAQGAKEIGQDAIADVGNTYQAFLMSDAGWRVPGAHDDFTVCEQIEPEEESPAPEATVNLDYC